MKLCLVVNPKNTPPATPIAEKDHPEIDTSNLLDSLGIKQYQSLIGALQWLVTSWCLIRRLTRCNLRPG